jgi:hypothetical protein
LLEEEGWRYSSDTGWNDWDIHIYGNFFWSVALQTVTEYHGGPKCLTRAALRNRFVATTVIMNLVIVALLTYHALSVGSVDVLALLGYGIFLLFLWNRARTLKARVAELVDLAAHRVGLQRIIRARAVPEVSLEKRATVAPTV